MEVQPRIFAAQSVACTIAESKPTPWSQPVAFAHSQSLEGWNVEPHSRVVATHGSSRISVWLLADDSLPPGVVMLSRRARRMLSVEPGGVATIAIPARAILKVVPALVDDLPEADEVDVSAATVGALGAPRGSAMLVTGAGAVPVKLRQCDMADGHVRMSMLTRALVGLATTSDATPAAAPGEPHLANSVQLTTLGEWLVAKPAHESMSTFASRFRDVRVLAHRASRLVQFSFELFLRAFLRAPVVALRTTEALVGDDANHVVRMAPAVLPLVGVKAGDQVIVSWEGRQSLATVLERVHLEPQERAALRLLQRVDKPPTDGDTAAVLDHLAISIPAETRSHLGMPRRTVVTVRRRLSPVFAGRLNDLTIPVGGLLLAAATIEGLPIDRILAGIVLVAVLAMLPLRHRTPPRGRWL